MFNRAGIRVWDSDSLPPNWFERAKLDDQKIDESIRKSVEAIISQVKQRKDAAVIEYTEKFDKVKLTSKDLRVSQEEIQKAYENVSQQEIDALKAMKERLRANESKLLRNEKVSLINYGITVRNVSVPLESVGCYVPAGRAVYPSTVVMTAVPAKVAGVQRVVVCSPPTSQGTINPLILVATDICDVDEVYKVGGVQAIAALAYGTQTIKPVRKIVGPGSAYVTAAKVTVSRDTAIDMPAGPSEVLILADETAEAKVVAADMISQAEHGKDSTSGLITTSKHLSDEVIFWLEKLTNGAQRKEIVSTALTDTGFIIACKDTSQMIKMANAFAPEHLEIMTKEPEKIAEKITTAGLVLIGKYSSVAMSDYGTGTNHVLPTCGFGKTFSGLSASDFIRRMNIIECSKEGLAMFREHLKTLTEAENLPNHYRAAEARFENE